MLDLASQTVGVPTDRTIKNVDLIFVDAPAAAVGRTAVKTPRLAGLRLLNAQQ